MMNTHDDPTDDLANVIALLSPQRRQDVATARAVAAEAAALLVGHTGHPAVCHKPDGSIVTAADIASDRLIAARLHAACPGDTILSEESTAHFEGGRTWVIDPLDGTTNFAAGLPIWGVTLALLEDGVPTVGVSVFPRLGLDFTAIAGGGAFVGSARLSPHRLRRPAAGQANGHGPSPRLGIGPDDLIAQCSRTASRWQLHLPATRRTLGSTAFHLALVASGTCRASVTMDAGIWDVAAGWLLVTETGGTVSDDAGMSPWPLAAGDWSQRRISTIAAADAASHGAVRRAITPVEDDRSGDDGGVRTAA